MSMPNTEIWDALNDIPDPLIEYDNDTDLDLETLQAMEWTLSGTEKSGYSAAWVDTYTEPTGAYAMKVFNDGFVEFYELA
jgi:hypothetical protein